MTITKDYGNFIEVALVEEANKVNMNEYRLLEKLTGKKGLYCFVKRAKIRKGE